MKKRRGIEIKINLSNKAIYTLIIIGILVIIGIGVYAYTGNVGHTSSQIDETDPTVLTSVKDGVSWSELSGIPSGFADGVDDGGDLKTKIIEIGNWNMDSVAQKYIEYGLDWDEIVRLSVIVRADSNALNKRSVNLERCGNWQATPPSDNWLMLSRDYGGGCDNEDFNSASYNRGWIVINYL